MTTKKETTKKTTAKKTTAKKTTAKKITIDNMACKGKFLPCSRCFKCHFSNTCFSIMQENTKKAASNSSKKKTTKKSHKMNSNKLAFLAIFSGGYELQSIGDVCKRFVELANITGTKNAPKSVLQSINTLLADRKNNKYLKNSDFYISMNSNYGLRVKDNNKHANSYLY